LVERLSVESLSAERLVEKLTEQLTEKFAGMFTGMTTESRVHGRLLAAFFVPGAVGGMSPLAVAG
jgi:hypothetical protein